MKKSIIAILFGLLLPLATQLLPAIRVYFSVGEIIAITTFSFIVMLFPMLIRIANHIASRKSIISANRANNKICLSTGVECCCVEEYINELGGSHRGEIIYSAKPLLEKHRLIMTDQMNEEERLYGQNTAEHPNREIWIFSYDLGTEVLGDASQDISVNNINNGVKYVYFHTNNEKERRLINKNINKIKSRLKLGVKVDFIPLESDEKDGIDVMACIIGSIMFISPSEENGIRSYFSLRGIGDPIYFRLPECPNAAYYNYFKKAKDKHDNDKKYSAKDA